MKLKGRRVLVTGADGFIGSHLVEELVQEGADVKALAIYNSLGSHGWLDTLAEDLKSEIEVILGDVRDPHAMRELMQGVEVVFNLAALIAIPYSYHAPDSYVDTNVKGALNLLNAARDCGVERFIQTSTSEVYGTAQFVPINEAHPLHPQSPYAATKVAADQLALSFYYSFALPVAIIRPFNCYGPRQSARAIIPTLISQISAGGRTVKVGSLSPRRDFTYVKDLARAFVAIAEADSVIGEVVNIGSGFDISIAEIIDLIASITALELQVEVEETRIRPEKSEVQQLLADNSKAKRLLGWHPAHGSLEGLRNGLKQTIEWFSDPANLKLYKPQNYNL